MKKTIIIFGFSGSGKTTLANRLAKKLHFKVIHPSGILRALCLGKNPQKFQSLGNRGFWESAKGMEILKNRMDKDSPPDSICDKIILKEAEQENIVIDSWSLPWLFKGGIIIYLKASKKTRAERVARRDSQNYHKIYKIISRKDSDTRRLYQRIGGFDIAKDHEVFDLTINTTNLPPKELDKLVLDYVNRRLFGTS